MTPDEKIEEALCAAFNRTKTLRDEDDVRVGSVSTTLPTTWIISFITGLSSAAVAVVIFVVSNFYLSREEASMQYSRKSEVDSLRMEVERHDMQWQKISEAMARIEEKLQALRDTK